MGAANCGLEWFNILSRLVSEARGKVVFKRRANQYLKIRYFLKTLVNKRVTESIFNRAIVLRVSINSSLSLSLSHLTVLNVLNKRQSIYFVSSCLNHFSCVSIDLVERSGLTCVLKRFFRWVTDREIFHSVITSQHFQVIWPSSIDWWVKQTRHVSYLLKTTLLDNHCVFGSDVC